MSYNGWTNYETWAVALWIDNEPGSYEERREMARQAMKRRGFMEAQKVRFGMMERGEPEWKAAWSRISQPDAVDAASGEVWQYMGSTDYYGQGWQHDFRNRSLNGRRQLLRIRATDGWRPQAVFWPIKDEK